MDDANGNLGNTGYRVQLVHFNLVSARLRYYVLAAGLALHLGIDYAMNIPMFEYITMAGYLVFVDSKDTERAVEWLKSKFKRAPKATHAPVAQPALELQK